MTCPFVSSLLILVILSGQAGNGGRIGVDVSLKKRHATLLLFLLDPMSVYFESGGVDLLPDAFVLIRVFRGFRRGNDWVDDCLSVIP